MFGVVVCFPSVVGPLRLTFKTKAAAEAAAQSLLGGESEIADDTGTVARLAASPAYVTVVDLVAGTQGKKDIQRKIDEALMERATGFGV